MKSCRNRWRRRAGTRDLACNACGSLYESWGNLPALSPYARRALRPAAGVPPGGRDAAAPGSRRRRHVDRADARAGHAGRPRFITTAPFSARRSSAFSSCSRCGAPSRSSCRRTMPIMVPPSIAARGHTTYSPSQNARFQIVASLSRPRRSTKAASSWPGWRPAQQIGLGHFAHMLYPAACVRARPAPATRAGGPVGRRRGGVDQQARARAGTGDGEFAGGEYTVAVSDRSGGPAWIARRRACTSSSGSACPLQRLRACPQPGQMQVQASARRRGSAGR